MNFLYGIVRALHGRNISNFHIAYKSGYLILIENEFGITESYKIL